MFIYHFISKGLIMPVEVNKMLLRIKYPTFPVEYLDDMY